MRTGYCDLGTGETVSECDSSGHEHRYRIWEAGRCGWWCGSCRCLVSDPCDHKNRPMCKARSMAVKLHRGEAT